MIFSKANLALLESCRRDAVGTTNEAHVRSVGADAYVATFSSGDLASAIRAAVRE